MQYRILIAGALLALSPFAQAAPVMMTAEWAVQACEAWNQNAILTTGLGDKWIKNDNKRGYKIVQMYRTDCGETVKVELKITAKDGKAICTYGGKPQSTPDHDVDYLMHAKSSRWIEMGKGEYGPMKAMMFGRLEFQGPMWEAMSVMGPFEQFLLLNGKVPSDTSTCPKGN